MPGETFEVLSFEACPDWTVEDFTGAVRTVASVFTTVHTCETIWSRYWSREEAQKKEEAENAEDLG